LQTIAQLHGLERLHRVVIDALGLGLFHLVAARQVDAMMIGIFFSTGWPRTAFTRSRPVMSA
jgi:hypothetical protein